MKFNKFAIIGIILLVFLTIGAVNALDNASNEIVEIDVNGNFSLDDDHELLSQDELFGQDSNDLLQSEKIITPSNIDEYEDGMIPEGEYKFEGVFDNSSFVCFEEGCVVDAADAEFINTAIVLQGSVMLKGLTINATHFEANPLSSEALVFVSGDDNYIEDLTINYSPETAGETYALYINGANNFTLLNSNINFSTASSDSNYKYAIKIMSSQVGLIQGNIIRANLPLRDVDYDNGNPGLDTDLVLNTGIKESDDLTIIGNKFFTNVIERYGEHPTLDCLMLESCNRVHFINNTLNETDFFTSQGNTNFLNVLDLYYSSSILVKNNTITVETNGGSEDEGTSYPIQLTGPYEDVVIDENVLYAYCRGPALGIYSQNYYGDTEIVVKNNKIDVTGLPTSNARGLVSGIELQDNLARIYNNDIKTKSIIGHYQTGAKIYGISYAQELNNNHNYDIQGNVIETMGDYAIYLLKAQNLTISNNSLISHNHEGNDAIYIETVEGTSDISGNYGNNPNVVTPENFFEFFNDAGELKEDITFNELIFKGEFNNLASPILILNPLKITGENAVFNNMSIYIYSGEVQLNNLTFIANAPLGSLIYIDTCEDVCLKNLNIRYSADSEDAVAIDIRGSNNVNLSNNEIFFESHISNDKKIAIAIQAIYSQDMIIDNNKITTKLPCIQVNTYDDDYYVMGSNNVNPVRFKDCNNFKFIRNNVNSTTNYLAEEFPTIQSLYIIGCSNSIVDHNNISMVDEFTPSGMDNYLYGIDFGFNTNVTFSYNKFNMSTSGGKDAAGTAYAFQGIQSDVIIKGNHIVSSSHGPNIGIYITSTGGETSKLLIENNFINVTGYASPSGNWALVTGIEIQNGDAKIYNNTIYTYNFNQYDDASYCYGISYAQYMYGNRSFEIKGNTVKTVGKYSVFVIDADYLYITNNTLFAHDLKGDYSINLGKCNDSELDGNYPYVNKSDANITIEIPDNIKLGETISINVTADTTSSLIVSINGENVEVNDGKTTYTIIRGGLHSINVFSRGNIEFKSGNVTKTFNVTKKHPIMGLYDIGVVKIGDTIIITPVTDSDGELTIKINEIEINGTYTIVSNGTYVISIITAETDTFNSGFYNTSFEVFKEESAIDISLVPAKSGEKSIINVNVTEGADGRIIINVNGTEYPINVYDKKLELILSVGEYNVFATYMGDNKYNESRSETKLLIVQDKLDANVTIQIPEDIKIGQTVIINVTGDTSSDLIISIDEVNVSVIDNKITYNALKDGMHTINVFAYENKDYKQANVTKTFNVNKRSSNVKISIVPGKSLEESVIQINVTIGATGTVIVKLNDTEIYNGSVNEINKSFAYKLLAGNYIVNATYSGDDYFNSANYVEEFNVVKSQSSVSANSIEIIEGEIVRLTVNVNDGATGKVLVVIEGNEFYGDISDNVAVVNISGLTIGKYDADIIYSGDKKYDSSSNNTLIIVKRQITQNDLTIIMDISQNSGLAKLTIKLPESINGKITIKIDEISYVKDLINGVSTLNVNNLKIGKHAVYVNFAGDDKYTGVSKSTSFEIKKPAETVKFTAKNMKFKAKIKVKKYAVTLKAGKNPVKKVQVTLKIKGKTYSAKTNAKGKATFKIKKLTKKGKYNAVIKFAGNNNFKPVTKTVKITVKK